MAKFPVPGGTYTNDWGNPRDGGSRSHKGNDIFAPRGTPIVAYEGGVVTIRRSGKGGNSIWIDGKAYYAHLDRFAVKNGQRVAEGQVIGYVGDSGNARGGSPHLHFGYDSHGTFGDNWVNPYQFLQASESGTATPADTSQEPAQDRTNEPDAVAMSEAEQNRAMGVNASMATARAPERQVGAPMVGVGFPGEASPDLPPKPPALETWKMIAALPEVSPETSILLSRLPEGV